MEQHIVRRPDEEGNICDETMDKVEGGSQKAHRPRILR